MWVTFSASYFVSKNSDGCVFKFENFGFHIDRHVSCGYGLYVLSGQDTGHLLQSSATYLVAPYQTMTEYNVRYCKAGGHCSVVDKRARYLILVYLIDAMFDIREPWHLIQTY